MIKLVSTRRPPQGDSRQERGTVAPKYSFSSQYPVFSFRGAEKRKMGCEEEKNGVWRREIAVSEKRNSRYGEEK